MQAGSPGSLWNATLDQGGWLVCSTVDFLMRKAIGISSHSLTEKKRKKKTPISVIILLRNREFMSWELFMVDSSFRNRSCSVASYNFHISNKTGDPLYCIRLAFIKRFKINNYKRISYKLPTAL